MPENSQDGSGDVAQQIRQWLADKTDPALVRQHPQTGLDYIPWSEKWRIVKSAIPGASVVFKERWESPEGFEVVVSIIVPDGLGGVITHDGLGFESRKSDKQINAYSDEGWKSAFSDAISRACVLLGVGLDLYHGAPEGEQAKPGLPCPVHDKPMMYMPGGISRKTRRPYNPRYVCRVKSADGTYCNETVWVKADDPPPGAPARRVEERNEVDDVPFDVPSKPAKVGTKTAAAPEPGKSGWRVRCQNGEQMLREFAFGTKDFEAWRLERFGKEFVSSLIGVSEDKLRAYHTFLVTTYNLADREGAPIDTPLPPPPPTLANE